MYVIFKLVEGTFTDVWVARVISIAALETKQRGDKASADETEGLDILLFVVSLSFDFGLVHVCILY